MMYFSKCIGAFAAVIALVSAASAAEAVATGKIKSVDAEAKKFVMTDNGDKDWTFKLSDDVLINRAGKESVSDLKANDTIIVCYQKGTLTWTAHYILIKNEDNKNYQLHTGTFKGFDAEKKSFTYTDGEGKDYTYQVNGSKVRLNTQSSKMEDIKIGDSILAITEESADKVTLKDLMVSRK